MRSCSCCETAWLVRTSTRCPTVLPLSVRLSFNLGVRVGHHRNQQVDEHDDRDDHEDAKDRFDERHRPPRVAAQRRQVLRVEESEKTEKEQLEDGNRRPGDRSTAAVSVTEVGHVGRRRGDRQVDGSYLEREATEKDDKDEKEQHEVLHHFTDDDRPRAEQMMERQEVEELDEAEEHGKRVELVTRVHERRPSVVVERHRNNVHAHSDRTHG